MKHCSNCKGKTFETDFTTIVTFELDEESILTATEEENIGHNGIFRCVECLCEYSTSDFKEIIHK